MTALRHLDLFSGIGGFALGFKWAGGIETVGFCEIDGFCQRVLAKHWPGVPIHDDIRSLDARTTGPVDIITGGYPCQPFSTAGKRRGAEDDRHLWPEMRRLVDECRPSWVVGENVLGHVSMGLDEVLSDLESIGYAARTFAVPAVAVDAPHRRMRVWIVAHSEVNPIEGKPRRSARDDCKERIQVAVGGGCGTLAHAARERRGEAGQHSGGPAQRTSGGGAVAHAECIGSSRPGQSQQPGDPKASGDWQATELVDGCRWLPEPGLGGMADGVSRWLDEPLDIPRVAKGVPNRADRLKALGNAVVPQIPAMIGRAIVQAHREAVQ